jgi:enoyl-CoA hydratase
MREDRRSLIEQEGLDEQAALQNEFTHGMQALREAPQGIERFRGGAGRHGSFG